MSTQSAGGPRPDPEQVASDLARKIHEQVSDLRARTRKYKAAIARSAGPDDVGEIRPDGRDDA